ncbi:GNAT family N-acetyltransferase [Gordonia sp. TBRC 11910]|uniref:GNAT family N-acetyltransferase n=1 Tax=Gordonia asplenii TaxID=2725283 RepID=A0A848KYF4_9ACTN|nr:GNAT family protein [Gordonia asplenii]NMO03710.1 GNAT family N-acetyltransferase [Gordonia asplenii]
MITGGTALVGDDALVSLHTYHGPPRPEARDLIDRARAVDAEMSFLPATPAPAPIATTIEISTTLHRWSAPSAGRARLAGVITLLKGSAAMVFDLVVDPPFRSTGVATAAIERIVATAHPVFADQSIHAICYGSHPAALRLAHRFGARPIASTDHLALHSQPDYRASHLYHSVPQQISVDFPQLDIVAGVGALPPDLTRTPTMVRAALDALFACGARSIVTAVDADGTSAISLLRAAAFAHDRTDVLVAFPISRSAQGLRP